MQNWPLAGGQLALVSTTHSIKLKVPPVPRFWGPGRRRHYFPPVGVQVAGAPVQAPLGRERNEVSANGVVSFRNPEQQQHRLVKTLNESRATRPEVCKSIYMSRMRSEVLDRALFQLHIPAIGSSFRRL